MQKKPAAYITLGILLLSIPFGLIGIPGMVKYLDESAERRETEETTIEAVTESTEEQYTTNEPETVEVSDTTETSETTAVPETTIVPEATKPPETTKASETTKTPETTAEKVLKYTSITSPISRGNEATVEVKGKPNTKYTIKVKYSSGYSTASGLGAKTADSRGSVSWTWKIGAKTSPGTYPITISGGEETIKIEITVLE